MNDNKLQDFVGSSIARGRITFGDVRRLARDTLPDGILTREDSEILLGLDANIARTDRAWTDWLVASIVEFAFGGEAPSELDDDGMDAWLETLFAAGGATPETRRRITRDVRRDVRRAPPTPSFVWEEQGDAPAVPADAAERASDGLQMAA